MKNIVKHVAERSHWVLVTDDHAYFNTLQLFFLLRGSRDVGFEIIDALEIKLNVSLRFAVLTLPKDSTEWYLVSAIAKIVTGASVEGDPDHDAVMMLRDRDKIKMCIVANALVGRFQPAHTLN